MKEYREKNKDKIKLQQKERSKKWYIKNKENAKVISKKRYYSHREDSIKKATEWRLNNPEKFKETRRKRYANNRNGMLQKEKEYREKNKERVKKWKKITKERRAELHQIRMETDPAYYVEVKLRSRLTKVLNSYCKPENKLTMQEYYIDWDTLVWSLMPIPKNRSKYHIDHIKPFCSFNLNDPKEVRKAMAPENTRWLLASENLTKQHQDKLLKYNGI